MTKDGHASPGRPFEDSVGDVVYGLHDDVASQIWLQTKSGVLIKPDFIGRHNGRFLITEAALSECPGCVLACCCLRISREKRVK